MSSMSGYRLRGDVGGVERSYPLVTGQASVGCVSTNDIVLPLRGVSRRHARLASGPAGLEVEDLDSRNGLYVNGQRVTRSWLRRGDEVRFGPVALRLEVVPSEEAQLAITLPSLSPEGLSGIDTTAAAVVEVGDASSTRGLVLPEGYLAGRSPAMAALHSQMLPLLQGDLPVLVVGETGVGKEYAARIVHASSSRRRGPFVAVNCAAIPPDLLEAEMFGIGKAVATGVAERLGRFQQANGGTLFLDEIGDLPLGLQAKLLRALQEREIQPLGRAPMPVDIRVLAATNRDLLDRVEEGQFRRDLYYRVAGFVLRVPPLRERREDLSDLVGSFVRRFAGETGRSVRGVTARALEVLAAHDWPGNVRELEHEVRRLVYMCPDGQAIESSMLSERVRAGRADRDDEPEAEGEGSLALEAHLQRVEDRLIRQALRRVGGNRTAAAKLLGISRSGLAIKMARLGISL
jgi:DNA-binding NtrC family response regulator